MSAVETNRRNGFKRKIPARFSARLIFFCMLFNSLPATFARQTAPTPDLIYCPLQKSLLRKHAPTPPRAKIKEPLDEICASIERKSRFFSDVSKRVPFLRLIRDREQIENLFFSYLESGNKAFARLAPFAPENFPAPQVSESQNAKKSGAARYKIDFDRNASEVFAFAQRPRPPTARKTASFDRSVFRPLETVSRRIQPRAPPVSL